MQKAVEVYCDFDGTVTCTDGVDAVLEALADPGWRDFEALWVRGEIGSKECLTRQMPLVQGGWNAALEVLSDVAVDPTFPGFAAWCRKHDIPLRIVSDGFDRIIRYTFDREDLRIDEVHANSLREEYGRLVPEFPHSAPGCGAGLCKCRVMEAGDPKARKIMIGDGLTDLCCSRKADTVFAKGTLIRLLREEGIPCIPFEDFESITKSLQSFVEPTTRL
jgi:2,3-diketo-5-methylthio-1-phosphopentane phosphatase